MGFTTVNTLTVRRDFDTREIVVEWHDDITGDQVKRFPLEKEKEALEFVVDQFQTLAM